MKIGIIGGSNSVQQESYSYKLNNYGNYTIENRAIGGTNSIHGLLQIKKYKVILNNDLIIFEYFINDSNYYYRGISNIEIINKTLNYIIYNCFINKKKLLFIFVYNSEHIEKYNTSPIYKLYKDLVKKFNISSIDSFEILKNFDNWKSNLYRNENHINHQGMEFIAEKVHQTITNGLNDIKINDVKELKKLSFDKLTLLKLDELDIISNNFSNSLVNVNFCTINDSIKLEFNKPVILLAIEYICDKNTGYIEINNNNTCIQKNLLKYDDFVLVKNKKMLTIVTFNNLVFNESKSYLIKKIDSKNIKEDLLDKEDVSNKFYEILDDNKTSVDNNINNLKLVSLFFGGCFDKSKIEFEIS